MTITPIFGILIRKQMEIIMKATYSIIRHSVFETNSSSCHSLALTKGDNGKLSKLYTDYQLDENGNLHFNGGEYAWGFDILSDFQSKFDYVMTYAIRKCSHYEFLDLMKSLHDVTQFNQLYYFDQLVGYWDEEENKFQFSGYYSDVDDLDRDIGDAYIEPNSSDLLNGIIEDEDKLKNLLFIKDSEIVIENDNHFFQVAGGNEKEVQKQIHNLLILMLPKHKHSMINDELVNQFIKVFGRVELSKMMKELSFSSKLDDVHIIKTSLNDTFASLNHYYVPSETDVGNLYDLFELVNQLFGSKYRRFNTVRKAVCFAGSISCLDQLYAIPDFMEYVFNDFKNEVSKLSTSKGQHYFELDKKMGKLSISNDQTLENMTDEQKECFEEFIFKADSTNLENFAKYYLISYLLLDKLKDVPLKKWTKQFTYEYHG